MSPSPKLNVKTEPEPLRSTERLDKDMQTGLNLNLYNMERLEYPVDPDAQATVTDFLDFTEYLPSDIVRSLTLVGNLDQTYCSASANIHDLTAKYAALPSFPVELREDPTTLRVKISESLEEAFNARTVAHAEAMHMADRVEQHYIRIKSILKKLQEMSDNYPSPQEMSPKLQKPKATQIAANRTPFLSLRTDDRRIRESRAHKQRNLRITVPGEVLAPYEVDYPSFDEEYDSNDSENSNALSITTSLSHLGPPVPKPKLKIIHKKEKKEKKKRKEKKEKIQRAPRAAGVMGTNVHSSVAGISTSNALAQLQPPSANAKPGDKELPWLQLNAWELAKLRKRMKKNAIWCPSDTMIERELKSLGRGLEAYRLSLKETQDTTDTSTVNETPQVNVEAVLRGDDISVDSRYTEAVTGVEATRSNETQMSCSNIKLNEVKTQKVEKKVDLPIDKAKEAPLQRLVTSETITLRCDKNQAIDPATTSVKILHADHKLIEEKIQAEDKSANKVEEVKKVLSRTPKIVFNKRKREEKLKTEEEVPRVPLVEPTNRSKLELESIKKTIPPQKKSRIEPVFSTPSIVGAEKTCPVVTLNQDVLNSPKSEASSSIKPQELPVKSPIITAKSPKKSSLPVVPLVNDLSKQNKKDVKTSETAANSRPRRISSLPIPLTPVHLNIDVEPFPQPTLSRIYKTGIEGVAVTATATIDRPRRTSIARNTPAPTDPHVQSRCHKRPAPGVATSNSSGSTTVRVVGKRSAATRKKPGPKKDKKNGNEAGGRSSSLAPEIFDEIDDEGNLIDPDEPRYCHCNRVSFGVMIGCEGVNCETEWFHLECVGLHEAPARTTKWYCLSCRVALGIGDKGEVNARGIKK
ncbi:putative phd-finger domain-containing protein [Golovinomyces cichoracearum]|uniref:Putative phd-finger domain-containing protein n=1 Tax=Golovinomyces cichoracearum TaxID=62708 RepID=A0A420IRV6_9PEZI|nr:putative phd-finger domain-containing protein [Golovinomyces cichoracearum]